jgi:hypothetical protein
MQEEVEASEDEGASEYEEVEESGEEVCFFTKLSS